MEITNFSNQIFVPDPKGWPQGFKFNPKNRELITLYLRPKLQGKRLPSNLILEIDVYAYTPPELYDVHKSERGEAMYFFTSTEKKYPKGSRPTRSVANGRGFWKASGADTDIKHKRRKIGARRTLVFYYGTPTKGNHTKTNWIMYEYKIPRDVDPSFASIPANNPNQLDRWVICKIYEHKPKGSKGELQPQVNNGEYDLADRQAIVTAPANIGPPVATNALQLTEPVLVGHLDYQTAAAMMPAPQEEYCVPQTTDEHALYSQLFMGFPSDLANVGWDGVGYYQIPPIDDPALMYPFW